MSKVNGLLLAELGENPLYRWIYSESPDFKRAMRCIDDEGNPIWDYRCPCGLNVALHSAECLADQLVVAVPRWEIRKIIPTFVDRWVLCCRQIPMSEYEWMQVFGTRLPYPKNGTWAPVATETYTVAAPAGTLPGENFTMAVIRGRQRSREIKMCDIANAHYSREEAKNANLKVEIRKYIADALPVSPTPGSRSGNVSLPAVEVRPKRKTGDLVTL